MDDILSLPIEVSGSIVPQTLNDEVFRFEDVTFQRESKILFRDLSLCIRHGDFVTIRGSSGAGKSTLIDLLLGIEAPTSGKVKAYGFDHCQLNKQSFYRNIAICPQFPVLLKGNIRLNIQLDDEGNDDHVALLSSLDLDMDETHLIESLGVGLSGGQAQRIGIARALFFDRDVLILDEPSSSLDKKSEQRVYALLQSLKGKKTIIVVSHSHAFDDLADKTIELG